MIVVIIVMAIVSFFLALQQSSSRHTSWLFHLGMALPVLGDTDLCSDPVLAPSQAWV